MCSYCSHLLSYVTIPHTALECNYRRTMICNVCDRGGHTREDCPNKEGWAIRMGKPIVEKNLVLYVKDANDDIKAVLEEYGVDPRSRAPENRKLLYDLVDTMKPPRVLVFLNKK